MTNLEFSNEFDVLYNNITSNQAPGLDEYEKSVFLTKAQDEIVKAYFNPKTNKVQEGFDGNEKRQIDFSMIMRSATFKNTIYTPVVGPVEPITQDLESQSGPLRVPQKHLNTIIPSISKDWVTVDKVDSIVVPNGWTLNEVIVDRGEGLQDISAMVLSPFKDAFFDNRDNTKAVELNKDVLMFINEYVIVTRGEQKVRLTVVPINYNEYSRLMSKPYKRPLKFNAWRLLDNSDAKNRAELIVGPNDTITQYTIRYVKRPTPIVLSDLEEGLSLGDNVSTETPCELDPILHPEILQRAVELAKAAYTGDLTSQVALGQNSQTNMGIVTQSR
jgi:hypothetical protein